MGTATFRPRLEVAEIFRTHGEEYRARHPLSPEQAAVMRHLTACRTAVLGGHVDACDQCGFAKVSYNSCRDRHCPKCQSAQRAAWLETRLERLLPVEYFHVVFTLPEQLQPLALKNRRLVYDLLFRAASETLLELAADPKRLGAQIGVTAILHTWGQNLRFHPHLHCVVTGGGLSLDGTRWVPGRKGYFLPVKVLSKLFRGKFLAGLKAAQAADQIEFKGSVSQLADPQRFRQFLDQLYRQAFVVYAKPPFGGAEQVFRYLGRYTHRVAISNARLISLKEGQVRFRYKDYANGSTWKVMVLSAEEFIRRFLLHVLPKRFVRIRHYGLLAGRNVPTKLAHCQELLRDKTLPRPSAAQPKTDGVAVIDPVRLVCPHCGHPLSRHSFDGESARTGVVASGAVNDTS